MGRLILTGANVLDGVAPAVPRTVVVEGERIAEVTDEAVDARDGDRVVDLTGHSVLPGMALGHFHSTYHELGRRPTPYGNDHPPSYQAIRSAKNLALALEWGFTTVIGAGAPNDVEPGVKRAIRDGLVVGPRLVASGRELSTTGHSNDNTPWHWGMGPSAATRVCDGPEEYRKAVRDEVKRGVEVIKCFVTGGHGTLAPKERTEISRDELAAAIEAAHDRGVLIRGHLANKPAIMMAIELGIDIVDHGDDTDDEVIAALAETGTALVPSIRFPQAVLEMMRMAPEPPAAAAAIEADLDHMVEVLPKADAAGVRILLGDDYGAVGFPHGTYGTELRAYVDDVGMAPLDVLRWATRNAAEVLGTSDELGAVAEGYLADLVVVEGDPSSDISCLADRPPRAVLKAGEVVAGSLPS